MGKKKRKRGKQRLQPTETARHSLAPSEEITSDTDTDLNVSISHAATQPKLEQKPEVSQPITPSQKATSKLPSDETLQIFPASPIRRVFAFLYDCLFLALICAFIVGGLFGLSLFQFSQPLSNEVSLTAPVKQMKRLLMGGVTLSAVFCWLYFPITESSRLRGSIGKKIFQLQVISINGKTCTFLRAHSRQCAGILTLLTLGIGHIIAYLNKERLTLHDRISQSKVVRIIS